MHWLVSSADVRLSCGVSSHNRASPLAISARSDGGADRDRTDDPLLAKQVLSQLSYSPGPEGRSKKAEVRRQKAEVSGPNPPSAFCLQPFAFGNRSKRVKPSFCFLP